MISMSLNHNDVLKLTAIPVLLNALLDLACIACSNLLRLQSATARPHALLSIIHSLLERVIFPAEDVVSVLAVSGVVSGT